MHTMKHAGMMVDNKRDIFLTDLPQLVTNANVLLRMSSVYRAIGFATSTSHVRLSVKVLQLKRIKTARK